DAEAIKLPGERTKNGREHWVPLSGAARAIIARKKKRDGRDLVFGEGEGGFSGWSRCKERLDEAVAKARKKAGLKPIEHWTTHDLRRTAATIMAESPRKPGDPKDKIDGLGIAPHLVEAILNHVSGHKAGVAGVYNRATYDNEKGPALELWADRLMAIV